VSTLSKTHISPLEVPGVTWCVGASVITVSKGGRCQAVAGGLRSHIKGFSKASRYRLLTTIGKVRRDAALPLFVVLTYPHEFPTARASKKHIDKFWKRLKRAFPGHGSIWKLEPQLRGAPHYHVLTWGCDLKAMQAWIPGAWFAIAGGGDLRHLAWHKGLCGNGNKHCVQQVRSWRGVWAYAAKYLGKTFKVEGWESAGRYWGVINPGNIPFGEIRIQELGRREAVQVQRYQRRFTRLRTRSKNRSMTIFCDADQWVEKLELISGN